MSKSKSKKANKPVNNDSANLSSTPSPSVTPSSRRMPSKFRKFVRLGELVYVFAVVGLIAIVYTLWALVSGLFSTEGDILMYTDFIQPVVMMDPAPFDSPSNLSNDMILRTSMMSALLDEKAADYEYDEMGQLLVPAADVTAAAYDLYGSQAVMEHASFDDLNYEGSYLFDPVDMVYRVPSIRKVGYVPVIENVEKSGSTIDITVGYEPQGNVWINGKSIAPLDINKYMVYRLHSSAEGMHIESVKPLAEQS